MDRNTLIGVVLISVVIGVWIFFQSSTTRRDVTPEKTAQKVEQQEVAKVTVQPAAPAIAFQPAPARTITIVSDLYRIRVSSEGATFRSWRLNRYRPWYKDQDTSARVDIIRPGVHEFGFSFRATNGRKVEAKNIPFTFDTSADSIRVESGETVVLQATAIADGGGTIARTYTFTGDKYDVGTDLTLSGLENVIPQTNRHVNLEWSHGIRYQESSSVDESNSAVAITSTNGNVEELDAPDFESPVETHANGTIDYIATRSKYFAVALIPPKGFDGSVFTKGVRHGLPESGHEEVFSLTYRLPYAGGSQTHRMTLFVGPMQYDTLAGYGLTGIMDFGWKWIIKPIGEFFMLPTLKIIHLGIPNYGIAIIIFALLMKLLLYPLGITQQKSARKMQLVAPLMTEIREKYKDDNQTQQQEMMKLYSEYGINPAGGCLPLLLQMPFLYALYAVLNLNIELRQAMFLPMWLTDLSMPDVILSLPFKLPLFNIDKFSGLALLMGATLFIQQKQAVTDPRQKAMVYMMPVMLTLMFSTLPSGLNLYYFVFNVVAIGQQIWQTKYSKNKLTLADLKKMPKRESWLQKRMAQAQDMAAVKGASAQGQGQISGRNGRPNNKGGKKNQGKR